MKIRKAGPEDIPKIRTLFNSYTSPPKSEYFFHWWNSIPSVTFCAEYEQEIVGLFVVLKRKLVNHLTCGVLMGLIVGTPWRGSGLFKELGERAMGYFPDMDLFCCLTNHTGEKALHRNFGFRTVDSIETMVLGCDSRTDGDAPRCVPITTGVTFLHGSAKHHDHILFLADEEFRHWRFAIHPRNTYYLIRADTEDEFIIINHFHHAETGKWCTDIADFEAEALEANRLSRLFQYVRLCDNKKTDMITIQAVSRSPLHQLWKDIGFHETDQKHYFSVKVNSPGNEYLYSSADWLIKWGDYLR
jgi:hypothetical protein